MSEILRWLFDLGRYFARTLDWPLLLALGALMGIGLAVLYSAGGETQGTHLMLAQGARFAAGLAAMWGLSRVSATRLRAWTPGVFLRIAAAVDPGAVHRHRQAWAALDRPEAVLPAAFGADEDQPADDDGLVPASRTVATAPAHRIRRGRADRRAHRADPAAARFRHRHAGRGQRRVRAAAGRAAVVVGGRGGGQHRGRWRRWPGSGSCAPTRRTAS